MKTGHRKQLIICCCLILLNLSFIWGNSVLPAPQSDAISHGVLNVLKTDLYKTAPFLNVVIRKTAHFCEFGCLGALLGWLFILLNQQRFHKFTMPLLFGSLAALTDESLQMLAPERGPGVLDVWIDILGVTAGTLLLLWGHCLWQRRKPKSNGGN